MAIFAPERATIIKNISYETRQVVAFKHHLDEGVTNYMFLWLVPDNGTKFEGNT